jgi:hypothetical protein
MVTLPGTVTLALLLARVALRPPEGAAVVRLTVQAAVPGAVTLAGEQFNASICTPIKLSFADTLWPLRLAVTVGVWLTLRVPVFAEKLTLLWLARTVTLLGIVRRRVLVLIDIAVALAAALLNETVQVALALLPNTDGAQVRDVS